MHAQHVCQYSGKLLPAADKPNMCMYVCIQPQVGISNLQFTDMNSTRNLFIVGFALYMGLSVPQYFSSFDAANGHGVIQTGSSGFNGEPVVSALHCHVMLTTHQSYVYAAAHLLEYTISWRMTVSRTCVAAWTWM